MEKRFKGTQEVAHKSINGKLVLKEDKSYVIAEFSKEEDTELFFDALTTIQKCDLMPSELLAQMDELLDVVKFAIHINTLIINKDCYLKDVVTLTESEIEELKAIEMFEKMLIKAQELINKIK